jgi:hypothetical protein
MAFSNSPIRASVAAISLLSAACAPLSEVVAAARARAALAWARPLHSLAWRTRTLSGASTVSVTFCKRVERADKTMELVICSTIMLPTAM